MKINNFLLSTFALALLMTACNSKKQQPKDAEPPAKEVSYFGQTPPGITAELFAPGTVSVNGRYEYGVSFSPNMDELYFSGNRDNGIQYVFASKLEGNQWTPIKKANLTKGNKKNEFEAFVDPNGDKLFFAAYDSIFSDEKIWRIDRLKNGWGEAKVLDSPINDDIVFYPNTAANGDMYYTSISKWKMFYAPNKNGSYPEAHELDIAYGAHGFISPSQDFILVDAQKDNDKTKDRDIHICFREKDGTWSQPINLGPSVNSDFTETCPSITPDGKYLFFSRYNEENGMSNIYWADATVIKTLKAAYFGSDR
ncbi:hypothetical protein [Flagellimonas sp.]|uniref:hypothetical protein n=1 Tax=Flagellimonas sp. TaxID=2058762 RepID=UPI003B50F5A5